MTRNRTHGRPALFPDVEHLLATCPIAIAHADSTNHVDYLNGTFERMFHLHTHETAGQELERIVRFVESDSKDALRRAAHGESVHITATVSRTDDTPIVVEFHAVPESARGPAGFWGLFQDITERRRTEHLLRVARELFLKTFQLSPMAKTISTVHENQLIEVNNTWVHLTGYSREEAVGHTPAELGLFDDPSDFDRINAAIEAGGGRVRDVEPASERATAVSSSAPSPQKSSRSRARRCAWSSSRISPPYAMLRGRYPR